MAATIRRTTCAMRSGAPYVKPAMELTVLRDPDELSERAGPYLLAHEAEHNVILGHLAHLSGGWTFGGAAGSGPVLCLVENAAGVAAAAVCVPPRNLAV